MTKEEFIKLRIESVVYNKISSDVVIVSSEWSPDKKEVLDEEYLGCEGFDGTPRAGLRMGDYEQWEHITDDIPDKVMLFIVKVKLLRLERFVHSRLK